MDAGHATLSRAGDVETLRLELGQPISDSIGDIGLVDIGHETRAVVECREATSLRGASREDSAMHDQCRITRSHVLFGPLGVAVGGSFNELVPRVDPSILGPTSSWAKASMVDRQRERDVQGGSIHAGLASGNNELRPMG